MSVTQMTKKSSKALTLFKINLKRKLEGKLIFFVGDLDDNEDDQKVKTKSVAFLIHLLRTEENCYCSQFER